MKNITFVIVCIFGLINLNAQKQIDIEGETLVLITEAKGKLDLLYQLEDRNYRYFVRTEQGEITELTAENYKEILENLSSDSNLSADRVKFTRTGLKNFIDAYNKTSDNSYEATDTSRVEFWLLPFAGITNNPFITNAENSLFGQFGAELELRERNVSPQSAVFMKLRHVLSNDDLDYSTTEIALGYRYRFIENKSFNLFADVKFATINFSDATIAITDEEGETSLQNFKDTAFDVPLIFGIGADFKLSENGYLTLNYNEIFAANLKNQGNFSTNVSLGCRIKF